MNTDLWSAQLVQKIIKEEKDQNSLCTPGSASTLTSASGGSSGSAVVDIFEDEDNADEKENDFDD